MLGSFGQTGRGPDEAERRRSGPTPAPWVMRVEPYTPGEGSLNGATQPLKLSSNENPLGPSPAAVEAFRRSADSLSVYPDGGAAALRGSIAAAHGLDPDRITCGAGSDELIALLIQAYCAPGDRVLHTEHAFSMYRISALALGAEPVAAPETALTADVDALLDAVDARTKLVFLANPNNPTGTRLGAADLARLVDALPSSVLLVLDGAYAEYVRDDDYEDGARLAAERPNVVMLRTFSKIHGLSALRLGWAYAPAPVVDALNRVRGPFNVSSPAQAAGEASMRDRRYLETCALQNEVWRDWLVKELTRIGFETPVSHANFVIPSFGSAAGAVAADAFLRARGVIVRRIGGYGLPDRLRITVGDQSENRRVVDALAEFRDAPTATLE